MRIKIFENFDDDDVDHGKYKMRGNTYIPKKKEIEFVYMTEDIKNVFNDIVDLGSKYSVSYNDKWYLTEVIITLNESLFDHEILKKRGHLYDHEIDFVYGRDFKEIDKFCEDELEYRLERVRDLFGVSPSLGGRHILENKDGLDILHEYPDWKNVYITKNSDVTSSGAWWDSWSYNIHMFFGSVQKELPYGVKAKPLRKIDNNGRYID